MRVKHVHVLFLKARATGARQSSVERVLRGAELPTGDWGGIRIFHRKVAGFEGLLAAVAAPFKEDKKTERYEHVQTRQYYIIYRCDSRFIRVITERKQMIRLPKNKRV